MGRKDSSFSEVLRPLSRSGHCSVLSRGAFPLCQQQSSRSMGCGHLGSRTWRLPSRTQQPPPRAPLDFQFRTSNQVMHGLS